MANEPLLTREIKGLLPALEAKNIGKTFVVDGRDFMVDFEGPYSAFSSLYAAYTKLEDCELVADFDVEGYRFFFTCNAILIFDPVSTLFQPLFTFTAVDTYWPWSVEKVGGYWYFCKKGVCGTGLIRFDPTTWDFVPHAPSEIPTDPRSICKSYGRLIVLGATRVGWSNLDNGNVFTTSRATGTGSQGTSAYAPGEPLIVKEIADGFLYFSDAAIGKAEIIELETTFRHTNLTRQHKLLNPFAITTIDDLSHVFLTKMGLKITAGKTVDPWQELFSQHLIRHVYPTLDDFSNQPSLKLYQDDDRDWFFISVASNDNPTLYGMAYALNISRGEWGRFDKAHYGFGKFNLDPSDPTAKFNLGYIDSDGYLHKFIELPYSENSFSLSGDHYLYQAFSNFPSTLSNGIWNAKTLIKLSSQDTGLLSGAASGIYAIGFTSLDMEPTLPPTETQTVDEDVTLEDWMTSALPDEDWMIDVGDEDWMTGSFSYAFPALLGFADAFSYYTAEAAPPDLGAIGAYIEVGLLRLPVAENPDEMSLITNLSIGMFDNTRFGGTEDWMSSDFNETIDWMTADGIEDWGYGIPSRVTYSMELIATNDGINTFSRQVPTMMSDAGAVQFYVPFLTGIFHKVRIAAAEVDQAFHLKFLEASGSKAGRL